MNEPADPSLWRFLIRASTRLAVLLLLAATLVSLAFVIAKVFGTSRDAPDGPSPVVTDKPTMRDDTPITRPPIPYAPEPWPSFPGRRQASRPAAAGGTSAGVPGGATETKQNVPVGVSVEEYQASVAAGKKIFLPDPKGECSVTGPAGGAQGLANCFAPQAAR